MQNPSSDNPQNDAPGQAEFKQWPKELAELERQHIESHGWSPSQAGDKIKPCWVVPYEDGFSVSFEKNPPAEAWPAFATRELRRWKVPPAVSKRFLELFGFISKNYYPPPQEIFEMMLDSFEVPVPDENPETEITAWRHRALAWRRKYRELYPKFAELAKDKLPELDDLLMAMHQMTRAFEIIQSARGKLHCKAIDPVNGLLEAVWLKFRDPKRKPEFYFTQAGGTRTKHGYWIFKDIPGKQYDHEPLRDRLDKIKRQYPPG